MSSANTILAETLDLVPAAEHVHLPLLLDAFTRVLHCKGMAKADKAAMDAYRAILGKHREILKRMRARRRPFQFRRREDLLKFSEEAAECERSDAPHFGVSVMDSVVLSCEEEDSPVGVVELSSSTEQRNTLSWGPPKIDVERLFSFSIRCVTRRALMRWREGAEAQRRNREGLLLVRKGRALRAFREAVLGSKMGRFREEMVLKKLKSMIQYWVEFVVHRKSVRVRDAELSVFAEALEERVAMSRLTEALKQWSAELKFQQESREKMIIISYRRAERSLLKWKLTVEDCKKVKSMMIIFRLRRGLRGLRRFLEKSKTELYRAVEIERAIMKHALRVWKRYHSWRAQLGDFYSGLQPIVKIIVDTGVMRRARVSWLCWRKSYRARKAHEAVVGMVTRREMQQAVREWASQLLLRLEFQRDCLVHMGRWRLALALHKLAYNRRIGALKSSGLGYLVERKRLRILAAVCDAWLAEVRYRFKCARVHTAIERLVSSELLSRHLCVWRAHYSNRLLDGARHEMASLQWKRRCASRYITLWSHQAIDHRAVRERHMAVSGRVKVLHFKSWHKLAALVHACRLRILSSVYDAWHRESARVRYSEVEAGRRAALRRKCLSREVLMALRSFTEGRKATRQAGMRIKILAERRKVRLVFTEWLVTSIWSVVARRLEINIIRVSMRTALNRLYSFSKTMQRRDAEMMAHAVLCYFRTRLSAWRKRAKWKSLARRVVGEHRRRMMARAFGVLASWRRYSLRNQHAAEVIGMNIVAKRSGAIFESWRIAGRSKQILDRLFECHVKQTLVSYLEAWKIRIRSAKGLRRKLQRRLEERVIALKKLYILLWRTGVCIVRGEARRQRECIRAWLAVVAASRRLAERGRGVSRIWQGRILSLWIRR